MKRLAKWFVFVFLALVITLGLAFWLRPLSVFRVFNKGQMYFIGARSNYIDLGEIRVHYYTLGPADGSVVVLVHGLGGRSEDWEKLAPYLARAGYRVYLPDLPGYGESDKPADFSYSVRDEAKVVTSFFDALGLKQVDLGGWSMGGWIVQLVAAEHPERIRRLMLFDSAGPYVKPDWDIKLFTPVSPAELEKFDALLMPHPPRLPRFVAEDILRTSREHAWIIHRAIDSMLTGRDTTDALLPTLKMPVLLVWGDVDQITPLSEGQKIHQLIPQSRMNIIPGCGHLAPNECAGQIGPGMVSFLKQ
ncbi:alpha/beta hydrolase [Telmatobacter sp. DSM 110680]|uniref:Alpha/beta hydrolase n=1 Tax=Telmatobacter sp. DSM 110680 TaxID=3036704 RepID=A0AAU7DGL3_9BACT